MNDSSGDTPIDVATPQQLGELKCTWEKTSDFLHFALEKLTSEPAQQLRHRRSSPAFMHPRSALRRRMMSLVRFS